MATGTCRKHILLTGLPGVGKTTLVQSICQNLREQGVTLGGFYTKELRQDRTRIGFDVVTLDGHQSALARLNNESAQDIPVVGRYVVYVPSFEQAVLPVLSSPTAQVMLLDEIGKMEMFSRSFCAAVRKVFDQEDVIVLATVPVTRGRDPPLLDEIKNRSDCMLQEVTIFNRDSLGDTLTKEIMKRIKH